MVQLLIKNGMLLDPSCGLRVQQDIAVQSGRITAVGNLLDESAEQVIDASGCYVTPGLIDFHAHAAYGISDFSMPADVIQIPNGVTSMVDAGSAGTADFEGFYRHNVVNSVLTIKSFLHVTATGQLTHCVNENPNPELFDRNRLLMLCEKYKGQIIGLKLRQSRDIVGDLGLRPLEETIKLADEVGLRVSVHATDSPGEVRDTLRLLRPGDIFCHMFHLKGKTILDAEDVVLPEVWEARKRGVLFELGHGAFNFSGKIATAAIQQGFLPDIVSSDLSLLSAYKAPTYSFSYILSELLNLGISFEEILRRCTQIPAALMNLEHDGFLKEGKIADLAILQITDHEIHYVDRYQNHYEGSKLIKTKATVKGGCMVYRAPDFL